MRLRRYEKDARSIPVMGDDSGMIGISPQSSFTLQDQILFLTDPENGTGTVSVGTHIQYVVDVQ